MLLDAQEHRAARRRPLQGGRKLARVHRIDAVVAVGAQNERRWILRGLRHPVVGRIGVERGEVFGVVDGSVFLRPRLAAAEELIAEHVEERDAAERSPEELGALCDGCPDQQPTVGGTKGCDLPRPCKALPDQLFGDREIVVEDVLLFVAHPTAMPRLPVLASATQVGDDPNTSVLEPRVNRRGKYGSLGGLKSAVPVEHRRGASGPRCTLEVQDEKWNARSISARSEELLGDVLRRVHGQVELVPGGRLAGGYARFEDLR